MSIGGLSSGGVTVSQASVRQSGSPKMGVDILVLYPFSVTRIIPVRQVKIRKLNASDGVGGVPEPGSGLGTRSLGRVSLVTPAESIC